MAGRSFILVMVLVFGVLFSILYVSSIVANDNGRVAHDPKAIQTEPKVSQLQALQIIENDLRAKVPELQETRLMFQLYNFSAQEYSSNPNYAEYITKIGHWPFEHIREHPELLQIPLRFVHANGTIYNVKESTKSFEKICDQPSFNCPMGRFGVLAKDRLVYNIDVIWQPSTKEIPRNESDYIIDAESGKIIWNSIDYQESIKPMPNVNFDNKTLSQLFRERANPPQTTNVDIEYGSALQSMGKGYFPKEVRVTLGINNRVVWTNSDDVPESVVSDTGYVDKLTGKKFESGLMLPNSEFEFVFTEPGEYSYHAEPHPWMTGKVIVLESFH